MRVYHDKRGVYTTLSSPKIKPDEVGSFQAAVAIMGATKDLVEQAIDTDNIGPDRLSQEGEIYLPSDEGFVSVSGAMKDQSSDSSRPRAQEAQFSTKSGKAETSIQFSRSENQDHYRVTTDTSTSYLRENIFYNPKTDKLVYMAEETFRYPEDN